MKVFKIDTDAKFYKGCGKGMIAIKDGKVIDIYYYDDSEAFDIDCVNWENKHKKEKHIIYYDVVLSCFEAIVL